MNQETNENGLNYAGNEGTMQNKIENAFSDLISEYFEEDNNANNAGNINAGPVLDWDSVANGQLYTNVKANAGTYEEIDSVNTNENGILYNNLENINESGVTENQLGGITGEEYNKTNEVYKNIITADNGNGQTNNEVEANGLYNEVGKLNTETIVKNAYGVVTINGELLNGIDNGLYKNVEEATNTDTQNNQGTAFKLTQGNLPAKIGFWTKVRNFFISDSKIQYSVQQPTQNNGGIWNKLQNFFSFGKNK